MIRAYQNNRRIATGKIWKDKFLQVYPEEVVFNSEEEWRSHIYSSTVSSISFQREELKEEEKKESENWTCAYCKLPCGNDHRTCIVNGFDYDVVKWENARIFPTQEKKERNSEWKFEKKFRALLPAGQYYIGDLCYALKDQLYDTVFGPSYDIGYFSTSKPEEVFMMGGPFDDGTYRGTNGKQFEVDSGTIGIASLSTLEPDKAPYYGGHMYTFKSPVHVNLTKGGNFTFYGENHTDPHLKITIHEDEEYEGDSE